MPAATIYMPLLDEGTTVWRPVEAERLPDGSYLIIGEVPDEEQWEFQPGERVAVRQHVFSDGTRGMVADRKMN